MTPKHASYDVVIVGGAIFGSSVAWWLTQMPGFNGTVLVVERDPSYKLSSTAHTNSCMRQQFSSELNIRISQFAADFVFTLDTYNFFDKGCKNLCIKVSKAYSNVAWLSVYLHSRPFLESAIKRAH